MGEYVRARVLRALGLAEVWMQLEALTVRMRRVEQDVQALQEAPRLSVLRGTTIPAPGGAPPVKGDA